MASAKQLTAAQQFLTRSLTTYEDELFGLLYQDMDGFASQRSDQIVNQERRVSIYGVRGVGKSTAMQGVLWKCLVMPRDSTLLPVTVIVTGAKSAASLKELEEGFYRSVIAGIAQTSLFKRREDKLRLTVSRYAPWIARKTTEALGLIVPPLSLASDLAERSVNWLVSRMRKPDIWAVAASRDVEVRQAADLLVGQLSELGVVPVFAIDELDKSSNDTLLSDFFDGNQSWFEGKRVIVALTYTFGESVKETVASSIRRLATVETYPGITSEADVERVIHARAFVGVSQVEKDETIARGTAESIFPQETIKAILNVSAPNTFMMLERAYEAINNALQAKASEVKPEHVIREGAEIRIPTRLEQLILRELVKGRLTPADLSERLERKTPSIVRSLAKMMRDNWVVRVGAGKRAYYSLTARGEAASRRRT